MRIVTSPERTRGSVNAGLPSRLCWKEALRFPVATREARKDVIIGGILLLVTGPIGWLLNLGNRLNVVARLARNDQPYFTGFSPWGVTIVRGSVAALAITSYLFPAAAFFLGALAASSMGSRPKLAVVLAGIGTVFFLLAIFTLPGCMTVYAVENRASVLANPVAAFGKAWRRRRAYSIAWAIALSAILLSFLGLLMLGVGFLFTSVWAWEVAGYVFTVAIYSPRKDVR